MTPEEQARMQYYLRVLEDHEYNHEYDVESLTELQRQDMADIVRRQTEAEPWKEGTVILKGREN